MKCPACGNTKEFKHFCSAWMTRDVIYDEAGECIDAHGDQMDIDSTEEIICTECEFTSLPEVFGFPEPGKATIWREVTLKDGEYTVTESEIVDFYHTRVRGHRTFSTGGDIYMKLYTIHYATSVAELPEVLIDDHQAVRNSAIEKANELRGEEK